MSIVGFLFPRSRLFVTLGRLFRVEGCGKPGGAKTLIGTFFVRYRTDKHCRPYLDYAAPDPCQVQKIFDAPTATSRCSSNLRRQTKMGKPSTRSATCRNARRVSPRRRRGLATITAIDVASAVGIRPNPPRRDPSLVNSGNRDYSQNSYFAETSHRSLSSSILRSCAVLSLVMAAFTCA